MLLAYRPAQNVALVHTDRQTDRETDQQTRVIQEVLTDHIIADSTIDACSWRTGHDCHITKRSHEPAEAGTGETLG